MRRNDDTGFLLLEAYGFPDDAFINWVIDGNWLNFGGPVLELTPDMLDGAQEVCAFYETPECPMGVWACEELEGQMGGCIDESLIDPNMACTEEWAPVCGCDGVTYSNACYATFYGGVTSFEEGECGDDGCIDESLDQSVRHLHDDLRTCLWVRWHHVRKRLPGRPTTVA